MASVKERSPLGPCPNNQSLGANWCTRNSVVRTGMCHKKSKHKFYQRVGSGDAVSASVSVIACGCVCTRRALRRREEEFCSGYTPHSCQSDRQPRRRLKIVALQWFVVHAYALIVDVLIVILCALHPDKIHSMPTKHHLSTLYIHVKSGNLQQRIVLTHDTWRPSRFRTAYDWRHLNTARWCGMWGALVCSWSERLSWVSW